MYISLPFFFQCFVLFKKCCERETPSNYFVKLYFYRSYSNAADGAMEKNNAISNRKNEVFIRGRLRVPVEHQVWHNLVIRSIFRYIF